MTLKKYDSPTTKILQVRFEHCRDTIGIGIASPRLSWIVETPVEGWRQRSYEVEAYDVEGGLVARVGPVASEQSVLIPWPFAPLYSRQRLGVRVRVGGSDKKVSSWSNLTYVEAGLLSPADWESQFITPAWEEDITRPRPAPLLRRAFMLRADVAIKQARLYITALGVYEAMINGRVVGDEVLAPGWTSYDRRLVYQTFDVTSYLQPGENAIGVILGDGWYRGRLGFWGGRRNLYGERLALLAQLEVCYIDGSQERICSDLGWRVNVGPIVASDLYDGEIYDARLELPGWAEPGYEDRNWHPVSLLEQSLSIVTAQSAPPVRRIELVPPVTITGLPNGRTLLDFGQNLVGRLRLKVRGDAGCKLTLRHAEVLENGELCTRTLRTARATDCYILRGNREEIWEPHFTFHGFRYAEVEGWPYEVDTEDIQAVVCHSDLERTGWFECSDPLLNRLHENVVWSMRGNFVSIPMDCPQRDERLGWTGDIQVFAPTACFLYDCASFLSSWLSDLALEQTPDGVVPLVVPDILSRIPHLKNFGQTPVAAWGDAAVTVPWTLYQRYGDAGVLETQFDTMRAWVDVVDRLAGENHLWDKGFQFGDWLDPTVPAEQPATGRTDPAVIATAYFARSAEIVGLAASVLGRKVEKETYLALAAIVRKAFNEAYVHDDGFILSDTPTAYALALQFDLVRDKKLREAMGRRLISLVEANSHHIATGFVGTPLICDALCSVGAHEAAYRLLMQRECPSWLYPVTMGATTIWERWDSLRPDGSVNVGEMTSFNHYALGAVADWLHRVVAGLAPGAPGYLRLLVQPIPGGGLQWARARLRTPYGMAEVSWQIDGEWIEIFVVVPPNATASVTLPGLDAMPLEVGAGRHRWKYIYRQD